MPSTTLEVAILLADIAGSTRLYQAVGDARAQRLIGDELARLQAAIGAGGGVYIREKGDDVLAYFDDPADAFRAARVMLADPSDDLLTVHVGLHFGLILLADEDIFGDSVNLTARLAALANAGEALLSRSVVDRLPAAETSALRPLDSIWLKGISAPIDVHSFTDDDTAIRTRMVASLGADRDPAAMPALAPEVAVLLTHDDHVHRCREAESLVIGRSTDCGIVVSRPWVSRRHAVLTVRQGKVILEDRSSAGTYLAIDGGHQFLLRRESALLTGGGVISPAMRINQPEADLIQFDIVQRAL